MIELRLWVSRYRILLQLFEEHWNLEHKKDPEHWPLEMQDGDWWEQFEEFEPKGGK